MLEVPGTGWLLSGRSGTSRMASWRLGWTSNQTRYNAKLLGLLGSVGRKGSPMGAPGLLLGPGGPWALLVFGAVFSRIFCIFCNFGGHFWYQKRARFWSLFRALPSKVNRAPQKRAPKLVPKTGPKLDPKIGRKTQKMQRKTMPGIDFQKGTKTVEKAKVAVGAGCLFSSALHP